jgi:hypothetical protein
MPVYSLLFGWIKKKNKCRYCEAPADCEDLDYYFCSLECLIKYSLPGSYLDQEKNRLAQNGNSPKERL